MPSGNANGFLDSRLSGASASAAAASNIPAAANCSATSAAPAPASAPTHPDRADIAGDGPCAIGREYRLAVADEELPQLHRLVAGGGGGDD